MSAALSIYRQPGKVVAGQSITNASDAGVFIRYSDGAVLSDVIVRDCKAASSTVAGRGIGIFDSAGVRILRVIVSGNGRDGQPKNGDGILDQGTKTEIAGGAIVGNGDNADYEHGIYAAGRDAWYHGSVIDPLAIAGNAGAQIKLMGTGRVEDVRLFGGRYGLVLDDGLGSSIGIWTVRRAVFGGSLYAVQVDANVKELDRFDLDENTYRRTDRFNLKGQILDFAGWRKATGRDPHSILVP